MNVDLGVKTFFDTNILEYAYDRSAGPKHTEAARLLEHCWENENGCLSIQILQEFYVVVTRKIAKPLDPHAARQIVTDLARWRVHSPDTDDLIQAIGLQQHHSLSFWDAVVVQSAIRLGCALLLSEDLQHGQTYRSVNVTNPFIFMD